MSLTTLERNDSLHLLNSYVNVYKLNKLYKIKKDYKKTILRIVKKSILGTNFIYFYSKHGLFISAIFNLVVINLNFLLFPKLLYSSKFNMNNNSYEDEFNNEAKSLSFFNNNKFLYIIFRLVIINLLDISIFVGIIISYKRKLAKINKYMEHYTKFAIESENNTIKNKYNCDLSKDGKFNIIIKSTKDSNDINFIKNNNTFFEYVINLPNIRYVSNYVYRKIFKEREKEIINRIIGISNEIEYKYKKKLITFLLIIVSIIIYIPLKKLFATERNKDFLNYFGILILMLFVERNNFLKNKDEQIERVSLLNHEYISSGYYIYINNNIISIFFVKENYRSIEYIDKIKELNEKLLHKFELL